MKYLKLLAVLCIGFQVAAQEYELGNVTVKELEQKQHPLEPSAAAAILFSKGQTSMTYVENSGFVLVTEVEMRIKIYSKEGYKWATEAVSYYTPSGEKESLEFSKAVTYNLVNGEVQKTKLKSDGEFTETINKNWTQKKIVMPDVKEGSIVEYKCKISSPFIYIFPEWKFQEQIPVNYSSYSTRIPEFFTYNPNMRGYYQPKVVQNRYNKSIYFNSTAVDKNSGGFTVPHSTVVRDKVDYQEYVVEYSYQNLPSLKDEDYVSNINNYSASIEHELTATKFPNSTIRSYSTTWEDVIKSISQNDNFGSELKKTAYFEKDVDALLAGVTNPEEKTAKIFYYVQQRMAWNKNYGFTCDEGVKKAYTDKVGNVGEINLMLTAMLRYAGLNANPVLVASRSNKIPLFPNVNAYDYVIAAVDVNGNTILLDATSKNTMPNLLPLRTQNWNGRLINKSGAGTEISLTPKTTSRELVNVTASLTADGKFSGKVMDQYYDHNALTFRENYLNLTKDSYIEKLEKHYTGIEISEYNVTNDKNVSKPVVEDFTFNHNAASDVIGDKIYFNPMLFFTRAENPFKDETRLYPIDFAFQHQDRYMINITIPEGYIVESLPKGLALSMDQNLGSFKYNVASQNNQIQLSVSYSINQANVSAEYYTTLRDFYKKMIEKQNEKVVLKKA